MGYYLDDKGFPVWTKTTYPRDGILQAGGDVLLSDAQVELGRSIAEARNSNRRTTRNRRVSSSRGDVETNEIGARGELAFRQLADLEWAEDPFVNTVESGFDFLGPGGEKIECRTRGRGFALCVRIDYKLRCDLFVVMKDWRASHGPEESPIAGERRVSPVGWVTVEDFLELKERIHYPGSRRPLEVVGERKLQNIRTLLEKLGIPWTAPDPEAPRRSEADKPRQGSLFEQGGIYD